MLDTTTNSLTSCGTESSHSTESEGGVKPTELLNGLANHFVKIGDHESAKECALEAYRLDKGYAILVGDLLYKGVITQEGDKGFLYYYSQARKHKQIFAANRLGACYLYGFGTDVKCKKAFRYFAEGHSNGDFEATVNFALCFEKGYGTKPNKEIAYELYCEAVRAGNKSGVYALAKMICEGKLSNVDQYDAFTVVRSAYWRCLITEEDVELKRLENLVSVASYESQAMLNNPSIYLRLSTSTTLAKHFKSKRYFIDNVTKAFEFYEVSIGPVVDTMDFLEKAVFKLTCLENRDLERLKYRD